MWTTNALQLTPRQVLTSTAAQTLLTESPELTDALSFLSYTDKLLAGAWRFLTYFGRDSIISMLLMADILSPGEDGAWEAGIGALLERIDKHDGTVAHEESTCGSIYPPIENELLPTDRRPTPSSG